MCPSLSHSRDTEFDSTSGLKPGRWLCDQTLSNRELQARVRAFVASNSELAADPQFERGRYRNCQLSHSSTLSVWKGNKELTWLIASLSCSITLYPMSVKYDPYLLETVGLWLLRWCSDGGRDGSSFAWKIEDTPGRPEYILTRRGVDIIWETMITNSKQFVINVELCLLCWLRLGLSGCLVAGNVGQLSSSDN